MVTLAMAFRRFAARPWSSAVMVLMLAIGIGASTAVFSLMSEALLHPMGLSHPEQVVTLSRPRAYMFKGEHVATARSGPDSEEARLQREGNDALQSVAMVSQKPCVIRGGGLAARRAITAFITPEYFQVLNVHLLLGREFSQTQDRAGEPLVILGYGLWMQLCGGDRKALGSTVYLNGRPFQVVGVAPRGFSGHRSWSAELWCPIGSEPSTEDRAMPPDCLARLRPGATLAQARMAAEVIATRYQAISKDPNWVFGRLELGFLELDKDKLLAEKLPSPWLLLSASGLLLLLACANAGNLRLAELESRRQEFATRLAMGAGRRDLLRQILGENLLLVALAGLLGLWMAGPMMALLSRVGDAKVYDLALAPVLSGAALLMALGLVLVCAVLVGLPASVQAMGANLSEVIKEGSSRVTRGGRFQDALVMLQVALALVLVACGMLVSSGLDQARKLNLGFKADHIVALRLELPPGAKKGDPRVALIRRLRERATALPGVQSVCVAGAIPMEEGNATVMTFGKGRARVLFVGPGYFRMLGIPVLAGREMEEADTFSGAEIVSSTYAQRAWPGQNPLGKDGKVIGVVADHAVSQELGLHEPVAFWPMEDMAGTLCLLVRTQGRPGDLMPTLRQIVHEIDPDMPIVRLTSLEDHLGTLHHHLRVAAGLLNFCGLMALLLAVMGVQSLMAFRVSRQAREISLRIALGAQRRVILLQVLRRGMSRVALGLMVGSAGALALGRVFHRLLKGVEPLDPRSLVSAALLIAGASLLACLFPALRAASIDPARALREE